MNADQLGGLIRAVMAVAGGYAMAWGFSAETWLALTGAVASIVTIIWTWWVHTETNTIASAAAIPIVSQVVVKTPSMAMAVPSEKVVVG